MLFANVCAGFISSCHGECFSCAFFLGFWVSPWCLVHMGSPSLAGLDVVYKIWVAQVCLLLDTLFGRRFVGGITFVTFGENT